MEQCSLNQTAWVHGHGARYAAIVDNNITDALSLQKVRQDLQLCFDAYYE